MIAEKHVKILKRRAIEATEALVDAEIMWRNGQISDEIYQGFKEYFYIRMHLDMICAETNVDFQITQDERHAKTFLLTAGAVGLKGFNVDGILSGVQDRGCYLYVFDYDDLGPLGVVYRLPVSQGLEIGSGVINKENHTLGESVDRAMEILRESISSIDKITYF